VRDNLYATVIDNNNDPAVKMYKKERMHHERLWREIRHLTTYKTFKVKAQKKVKAAIYTCELKRTRNQTERFLAR